VDLLDEVSMAQLAQDVSEEEVPPRFVINCTGLLHSEDVDPEKSWREFDVDQMRAVFDVNTFGPAMAIKHLVPAIPRQEPAIFATLSARVGSIGDNRLGGWYSYRASKAAQNMLVRTASLEAKTRRPKLILVALHPGTVASELSEPFTKRLAAGHAVFTPEQSCAYLCSVLEGLTLSDSGGFFAWDGVAIPW
jgi:hypothetical protein